MISFLIRTIFLLIFISINSIYSQVGVYLPDPDQLDSLDRHEHLFEQKFDDTGYYIYKNLIHLNFSGFGDIVKYSNDYQVFDFALLGRPQYLAESNMLPHQLKLSINNEILNQSANGMFNTRFLSADQMKLITKSDKTFSSFHNIAQLKPLEKNEKEPFTRVKFFEGDNRYTDLDIFFMRDIGNNVQLKLAGFNKGYAGTGINNEHTGVMYDTRLKIKINDKMRTEVFWNRNHERSGMGSTDAALDHNYKMDASRTGVRFSYFADSSSGDKMDAGFTSVVNRHKNSKKGIFNARQYSDDYKFFIAKDYSFRNNFLKALFEIDQQYIWGNVFADNFSQTLLSINLFDRFNLSAVHYYEAGIELQSLSDYDPIINSFLSWNYQADYNLFSKIEMHYAQRYPNPVESAVVYDVYSGNSNLTVESLWGFSLLHKWQLLDFLLLQGEAGFNLIKNEIRLNNNTFSNSKDRNWSYLKGESHLKVWQMIFSAGGRIISAKQHISPKQSAWGKLIFHGDLFDGTIILDVSTNLRWYSSHNQVNFEPGLNLFYTDNQKTEQQIVYGFKIVGTVGDAEIYFEMDNFLENEQEYIESFPSNIRVVRFGVNWILWN